MNAGVCSRFVKAATENLSGDVGKYFYPQHDRRGISRVNRGRRAGAQKSQRRLGKRCTGGGQEKNNKNGAGKANRTSPFQKLKEEPVWLFFLASKPCSSRWTIHW